jgi:class 3 adenylate cyclase/tetratricopeptide (TPR) repeat protein
MLPVLSTRVAPRALERLLASTPIPCAETLTGTLVFCDLSGFTAATETLGRKGRIGAELMNELISLSFSGMLDIAESLGGDLLVFGGDALFLLFDGPGHVERGVQSAVGMRHSLRTTAQARRKIVQGITFTMSTGIHTGEVWLGAVGSRFPVLFPAGPAVSKVLQLEHAAASGEIVVSQEVRDVLAALSKSSARCEPHPSGNAKYLLKGLSSSSELYRYVAPAVDGPVARQAPSQQLLLDPLLADLVEDANLLEHRDASVAFVRCSGTDALTSTERLHCLATLVEQTSAEAATQGVCIMAADVAEDGVKLMLGAGLPIIRGEDADRLVSTLRAAVEPIEGVQLAAGGQAGPMLAGFVGSLTRRVYTGAGDAVNSAARIAANALAGEVVIGDVFADRLRSSWKLRVRAPFLAKGKREMVETRAVVDRLVAKSSVTAVLPFVGRELESSAIRYALTTVDAWIEISGAPGSGKSRLLNEVVLSDPEVRTLQCFGDPTASESPYQAIGPALLGWISDGQDAALVGERALEQLLAKLRRTGDDIGDALTGAVRRIFGVDGRRSGSTTADRRAVHRVVVDLLREVGHGPTVLVIEDAHWVDASSADLILALRSSTLDVRIISTRRLEGEGLLADGHSAERITLQPLQQEALGAAAREVANDLGVARSEIEALVARAEGNPLVVELLLDARARGLSADDLPPRAEELAGRLLDSLLPIHRHLLGVAAVCGAGSDVALVAAVSGLAVHQVESQFQLLSELADIDPDDGSVRFRHALVRDAAYARLPFKERYVLHSKVAITVERTRQDFDDTPLLAYHFHRAGDYAKAWRYGREAGSKAKAADAPVEAAAIYRRALEDAAHLDDIHVAELIVAWEALGAAEQRNGKPSEAEAAFLQAFELTHLLQAELFRSRGRLAADTRRLSVATRWYAKARRTASATTGRRRDQFLTGVEIDGAAIRYRQGKFGTAERTLLAATKSARRLRDDKRLAHSLYLLALVGGELGRPDAISRGKEAAELYEASDDKLGLARTLNNLGVVQQLTGEWGEALESYRRSTVAFLAAGDLSGAAIIQNNIGEILSDQGDFETARSEFQSALDIWRESKFVIGIALASSNLGRLQGRAGGEQSGLALLKTSSEMFSGIGGWDFVFETRVREAEQALRDGNDAEAELLLTDVPDTMAEAAKLPGRAAQRNRLLGIAAARQGKSAMSFLQSSLQHAEQAQNLFERACTALAISELEAGQLSNTTGSSVDNEVAEKFLRLAHDWFDHLEVAPHARRSF